MNSETEKRGRVQQEKALPHEYNTHIIAVPVYRGRNRLQVLLFQNSADGKWGLPSLAYPDFYVQDPVYSLVDILKKNRKTYPNTPMINQGAMAAGLLCSVIVTESLTYKGKATPQKAYAYLVVVDQFSHEVEPEGFSVNLFDLEDLEQLIKSDGVMQPEFFSTIRLALQTGRKIVDAWVSLDEQRPSDKYYPHTLTEGILGDETGWVERNRPASDELQLSIAGHKPQQVSYQENILTGKTRIIITSS